MSLLNTAGQIGADFIGYTKKAVLLLHGQGGAAEKANPLSAAEGALGAVLPGAEWAGAVPIAAARDRRMEVQYNPASISFAANAEPMAATYLQSNVEQGVPSQLSRPPSVVMRVDLIFDAVNVKDAFMLEKFRVASVNDIAASAAGVAKALTGGYSVQPQTNGLLAAALDEASRLVTFCWADLCFTGELTETRAQYIMFSVSGQPIRSKITLQIAQEVAEDSDVSYWDKAFDTCFAPGTGGRGMAQKAGNLLNLNSF